MGYWKSKVLPQIKKVFGNNSVKKAAAAEATKAFDDSKESINKEVEEKKTELQPKVVEVYEATSAEIKSLVREPKEAGLKKHSAAVQKFLDELAKIEFPGSKEVSEAATKVGAAYLPGPVFFIFEKLSGFLPVEEKPRELPEAEKTEEAPKEETEATGSQEKEIVAEEEKKEEAKPEETKPEEKTEEKKEEVKPVEEKKEAEAEPSTKTEEKPAEPAKP